MSAPFWSSPQWHAYEAAYGDAPGTRAALLGAADWETYVLDLRPDKEVLWRGVRKSYHSLINKKLQDVNVFGRALAHWAVDQAHALHAAQAGRETRSAKTWDLMADWLYCGDALVAMAPCKDGGVCGYAYAVRHEGWSYYFSGASSVRNVSHALIWALVLGLKAEGAREFELGWGHRATDTEKDCGIHKFKSGFGGALVPAGAAGVRPCDQTP